MINSPIYDNIIIVGVILNKKFEWYIASKLFWIMDLEKLSKEDYDEFFEDKENKEIRKDILRLSEKNVKSFLEKIKQYKVNDINELRLKILKKIEEQNEEMGLEEFYPALLLDFDKKILYSQFPEPFGFENYIPKDWQGKYMSFIENIKDEDKYWIYRNRNLL